MYDKIIKCSDWKEKELCKNDNKKKPLAMPIPAECRVMIVSQAPSKSASCSQLLADRCNRTFLEFLNFLDIDERTFHKHIYWTHYGKCYPGGRKGGDQWPTVHCAKKFLEKEINLCKQNGLIVVIGISEPTSKYLFSRFINRNCRKSDLKYSNIRNKKYEFDDIIWMFVKHTASTAQWSKDILDKNFILQILQYEVKKALFE